jgi:KDO2-lipid IV(A) lauroyltransferase
MAFTSQFDKLTLEDLKEMVLYEPDPSFKSKLERAEQSRRGRIMLGGHFGNWELQAFSFPVIFGPLSFVSRKMDNPFIDERVKRIRERLGNKQIEKGSSPGAILRVLHRGGSVGILSDVNSQAKEGVFVPFFGHLACTATGVATLAIRANAIIVPMWVVWDEQKGKYKIVYEDIIDPVENAGVSDHVKTTTAQCVAALEAAIRKYPDQWVWVHRRWKTRPPGEPSLY